MTKLLRLEKKLNRRQKAYARASYARKKYLASFNHTKDRKYQKAAARQGRIMIKEKRAVKKLNGLIAEERRKRPKSGTGSWGGSKSIIQNEVMPVAKYFGIDPTSGKRRETYGNPSSDHFILNTTAFAKDFATDSNYKFGIAIGKSLGINYRGKEDDYKNFYIKRAGKTFRVQIICGTHGTGPHTHVGIRRF